jgi:hypothetical protein
MPNEYSGEITLYQLVGELRLLAPVDEFYCKV